MPNVMDKLMTWEEQGTKEYLMERLAQQGYPSYALLLDKFALHLTDDPGVIAYMIPDKGIIVVNRFLNLKQMSTILRHEILHQYLEHGKRMLNKLGDEALQDASLSELSNIAADYEISNKGYTDEDKRVARAIMLNGEELKGLVTEDDHPDWVDLSYEEMLDKLLEEQKKNGSKGQQAKSQVQIGSQGDAAKQQAEAIARAAQIAKELAQEAAEEAQQSGSQGEKQEAESEAKEASDISKEAQNLADEISKNSGQKDSQKSTKGGAGEESDTSNSNTNEKHGIFSDYELSKEELSQIQERIEEIKNALSDLNTASEVIKDTRKAVKREKDKRKEEEASRRRTNPLSQFVSSLRGFIHKQIEETRDKSWKRFNPTYVSSGIMRQGRTNAAITRIPLVQVYYDNSGSWDNQAKQDVGKRGIDSLQEYVKKGLLKIEYYYFGSVVAKDRASTGGYTNGTPILEKIKETKPDNVIIITDGDIDDCREEVTVPGAVWFLFVNGVSNNLKSHLKGKQLTKSYEVNI